jgi:hypothetical protein
MQQTTRNQMEGVTMPPVNGTCGAADGGASGLPARPHGVWGDCRDEVGIYGTGRNNHGVYGLSANAVGVLGESTSDPAIYGQSRSDRGVLGYGLRFGVHGIAGGKGRDDTDPTVYAGVFGQGGDYGSYSLGPIGLYSESTYPVRGLAAVFKGTVWVDGTFLVAPGQTKSAAVPHPDGTLRQLYSLESPESWFEDFGRAELSGGSTRVELDADFAALVDTDDYHVFLTPEGETNGLYVSDRTPRDFEVREQGEGTSALAFSYRIVARRGDVVAERLKTVEEPLPPPERTPPEFEPPTTWSEVEQEEQ